MAGARRDACRRGVVHKSRAGGLAGGRAHMPCSSSGGGGAAAAAAAAAPAVVVPAAAAAAEAAVLLTSLSSSSSSSSSRPTDLFEQQAQRALRLPVELPKAVCPLAREKGDRQGRVLGAGAYSEGWAGTSDNPQGFASEVAQVLGMLPHPASFPGLWSSPTQPNKKHGSWLAHLPAHESPASCRCRARHGTECLCGLEGWRGTGVTTADAGRPLWETGQQEHGQHNTCPTAHAAHRGGRMPMPSKRPGYCMGSSTISRSCLTTSSAAARRANGSGLLVGARRAHSPAPQPLTLQQQQQPL